MVSTRWDPLFETRKVRRLPNLSWAGFPPFFSVNESSAGNTETRDWSIPLDIVRDGDSVTVKASLPGVNLADIEVTIEGGVLTIKAATEVENNLEGRDYVLCERRTGSFHRSLRLSEHVDTDNVEPRYENGVLTITLPVAESKKARHLTVAVGRAE